MFAFRWIRENFPPAAQIMAKNEGRKRSVGLRSTLRGKAAIGVAPALPGICPGSAI
jgi:hypothetical protein